MIEGLVDKIRRLAEVEGLAESRIIWDEVRYFAETHDGHGNYFIKLGYELSGVLDSIKLVCSASDLVDVGQCPDNRDDTPVELQDSYIYTRTSISEIDLQRIRREDQTI